MHLYFLTRGTKHILDQFITNLSNQFLSCNDRGAGSIIQVNVKPIQLFEVVFPEEHRDLMMRTLFEGGDGKPQHEQHEKWIWAIRKALGIKKSGDYVRNGNKLPAGLMRDHLEIMNVGEKKDAFIQPNKGVEQL